jgi:hypothetical protein
MDLSINEGVLVVGGGAGDSFRSAIFIKRAPKGTSAIDAEHMYLTQRFGTHGRGWRLLARELLHTQGRAYDVLRIVLVEKDERTLYFDVTEWLMRAEVLHKNG